MPKYTRLVTLGGMLQKQSAILCVVAAITTVIMFSLSVWSGTLREVAQGGLIAISVVAFFPILLVLSLFALFFAIILIFAIAVIVSDSDFDLPLIPDFIRPPTDSIAIYYRWLAKITNPVVLGIASGVTLSITIMWLCLLF